jgi:protein-S-isoprenylcysteine O-methyltransferase Ste14
MIGWVWTILYWGWFASEIGLVIWTRTRDRGGNRLRDRGSLLILWGTIVTCMTLGITWGESHLPNLPGDKHLYQLIAISLLVIGLLIRWWAILTLGRAFSVNVALREGQRVMKKGLFSVVRHPSYLGMMIIFIATGLWERNYISMAIILVPISIALAYRIHVEEIALREGFGEEYIEYSRKTKRLIPFIY